MRLWVTALVLVVGCTAEQVEQPDSIVLEDGFRFRPERVGRGQTVQWVVSSERSVLDFGEAALSVEGLNPTEQAVMDGFTLVGELTVPDDFPLGPVDAELSSRGANWLLPEFFEVVEASFTVEPDHAWMGELVEVQLHGQHTLWTEEAVWPDFGADVFVVDFAAASDTEATATVAVHHTALPGPRDVRVGRADQVVTLADGFRVDRALITATFDPPQAYQGTLVDFRLEGVQTDWPDTLTVEDVAFWDDGGANADIAVQTLEWVSPTELVGTAQLSNAALLGNRHVYVGGEPALLVQDAMQVLESPADLTDVVMGLGLDVYREIDPVTGAISEEVSAYVYFIEPLDPPCGPIYPPSSGPVRYDVNGVFAIPPEPEPVDCPWPKTVDAGDQVWFESASNVITLEKDIAQSTGQIQYRARNLTLADYHFGQAYDLRVPGAPDGVPAFLVDEAQPTVPADYVLLGPEIWGGFVHPRTRDFTYTWTPAETYPQALFSSAIAGADALTGDPVFAGALPWDDGEHTYTAQELSLLAPGPTAFELESSIEGRVFPLPFNDRLHQGDSVLRTNGILELY